MTGRPHCVRLAGMIGSSIGALFDGAKVPHAASIKANGSAARGPSRRIDLLKHIVQFLVLLR